MCATMLKEVSDACAQDPVASTSVPTVEPPSKKPRFDDFEELCDTVDGLTSDRNELSEYVNLKVAKETDICCFWRENKFVFPKLYQIACRVLCVPASSSASERVFSLAGRILEKRRTSLSSSNVNSLLFLNSNMQ